MAERERVAESHRFRNLGNREILVLEECRCFVEMQLLEVFGKGEPHIFAKDLGGVFLRVPQESGEFLQRQAIPAVLG